MIEKNVDVGKYASLYAHDTIRVYLYFFVGFLVPFSLGHPQLLVGVVVNTVLVLTALEISSYKKIVPLLFAPSLGVLARGLIFGPYTPFLALMAPFIWAGNAMLVVLVREFYKNRKSNYGIALGAGALIKTGFLFSTAFALVSLSILPALFLETMGIFQLATALVGGAIAFGLYKSGITRRVAF
jgi:hypothetical protein